MRTKITATAALTCTAALLAITPPAAQAKGDDDREIRKAGVCTGSTAAKLKVKEDDGGLEVEFEVDSNRNGQRWTYRMWRNGVRFTKGTRVTTGRSGSFSVERRTADGTGRDVVSAKARNRASGEVCRASLTF